MKKIPLTKGKYAIVDDGDYDFVKRLQPKAFFRKYDKEANRTKGRCWEVVLPTGKELKPYYVKHFLLRPKNGNFVVEARNGNNLDLRKENLILISRTVSIHNNKKRKKTASIYKGVYYLKNPKSVRRWGSAIKRNDKKRWEVKIHSGKTKKDGTQYKSSIYLGVFHTEKEAALAYNKAAKELYGDLAYQNKI